MNTRRQNPEERHTRQDAFASSSEFDRGILGNLVAARCQKLCDANTVAVLWWLQQVSWRDGGLAKFTESFLASHRHLVGTVSMHKFGQRPGQVYKADEVRAVRSEVHRVLGMHQAPEFTLKGERNLVHEMARHARRMLDEEGGSRKVREYPTGYPVSDFQELCEIDANRLEQRLSEFLVNPATDPVKGLWNMPGIWPALVACYDAECAEAEKAIVKTTVTRLVSDELSFCLESRSFVLIEGREGIGKTEGARAWCAQHAGRAVYVRLESGTDEATLYRSIARVIGTACSYGRKATEMKLRIQDTLQPGQLMLVLDEAHFLWPQSERSVRSAPRRVDWLRTALIDFGVPVALISTPQYFSQACSRFQKGGWNSLQIQRRLERTACLPEPDAMPVEDVLAVAADYFPSSDKRTLKLISAVALGTVAFLANIKSMRKRVDFLAARNPAAREAELVAQVLRDAGLLAPEGTDSSQPQATLKAPLTRLKDSILPSLPASRMGVGRLNVQPEVTTV